MAGVQVVGGSPKKRKGLVGLITRLLEAWPTSLSQFLCLGAHILSLATYQRFTSR